jgi:hypothetical protein
MIALKVLDSIFSVEDGVERFWDWYRRAVLAP